MQGGIKKRRFLSTFTTKMMVDALNAQDGPLEDAKAGIEQ